jgi:hypothetical protein
MIFIRDGTVFILASYKYLCGLQEGFLMNVLINSTLEISCLSS